MKNRVDTPSAPTVKYRPHPLVENALSLRQVLLFSLVLYALGIAVGFYLTATRGWPILLIGIFGVLTAIFYTAPPFNLKYHALGEPTVFLLWGPLAMLGAQYVQIQTFNFAIVLISLPFGILVGLVLLANNIRDMAFDKEQGIKTLPVMLGNYGGRLVYGALIFMAFLGVVIMSLAGPLTPWSLLVLLALPLVKPILRIVSGTVRRMPTHEPPNWIPYSGSFFSSPFSWNDVSPEKQKSKSGPADPLHGRRFRLLVLRLFCTLRQLLDQISLSALCLAVLAIFFGGWPLPSKDLTGRAILWGLLSALCLYGIFLAGNAVSNALFSFAGNQVDAIYAKGENTPGWTICLLLLFVTSPAEEIFWRGFLQKQLGRYFGDCKGWIIAAVLYAAVHISSLNFMLVGAAGVAGLFWGFMYWRLNNLWPVVISHALWTCLAFAVAPIH